MGGSMSSVIITGDTSGAITLQAPAVSGTTTLTLPSSTGTVALTGAAVTYSQLPTGTVLQVVSAILSTSFSTSSTSYVNSGLTASITPKFSTSKILVICNMGQCFMNANLVSFNATIYRGSTNLSPNTTVTRGFAELNSVSSGALVSNETMIYLDSPATTSSTTYTAFIGAGASGSISINQDSGNSTITLMEIAG